MTTQMLALPNVQPARRLLLAAFLCAACSITVFAQSGSQATDPTLDQVYRAAQAGHVDDARRMMDHVLQDHPNSAKAHYVEAEILARQGLFGPAKDELGTAERLAPGLPFARAEAAQALRAQLGQLGGGAGALPRPAQIHATSYPVPGAGLPWNLLLAIGGGGLMAWLLMRRGRQQAGATLVPAMAGAWPATPAGPGSVPTSSMPSAPAMSGDGGPSLGRQLAGGLATGVGVGAGVLAAEAIGHRLFDRGPNLGVPVAPSFNDSMALARPLPLDEPDFGVKDPTDWDGVPGPAADDWDA